MRPVLVQAAQPRHKRAALQVACAPRPACSPRKRGCCQLSGKVSTAPHSSCSSCWFSEDHCPFRASVSAGLHQGCDWVPHLPNLQAQTSAPAHIQASPACFSPLTPSSCKPFHSPGRLFSTPKRKTKAMRISDSEGFLGPSKLRIGSYLPLS